MSLDLQEIERTARDGSPFSNGTEGFAWESNWCANCRIDGAFRRGKSDSGCPIMLVAICGKTPAEWIEQDRFSLGDRYQCIEFQPDDGGGGDDRSAPPPEPMPGQVDMFEVFADEITDRSMLEVTR